MHYALLVSTLTNKHPWYTRLSIQIASSRRVVVFPVVLISPRAAPGLFRRVEPWHFLAEIRCPTILIRAQRLGNVTQTDASKCYEVAVCRCSARFVCALRWTKPKRIRAPHARAIAQRGAARFPLTGVLLISGVFDTNEHGDEHGAAPR